MWTYKRQAFVRWNFAVCPSGTWSPQHLWYRSPLVPHKQYFPKWRNFLGGRKKGDMTWHIVALKLWFSLLFYQNVVTRVSHLAKAYKQNTYCDTGLPEKPSLHLSSCQPSCYPWKCTGNITASYWELNNCVLHISLHIIPELQHPCCFSHWSPLLHLLITISHGVFGFLHAWVYEHQGNRER